MATAQKTVCFAFDTYISDVISATVTNLTQTTLYIPESSPTFKSVFVEVGFEDGITATGGTIREHEVHLRLGGASYSHIYETNPLTHTSENMAGVIGPLDFTSHFTANWTGTSMTCDLQVYFDVSTGSNQVERNITGLVYVTYEYDDTSATQIKTVRIPFDSPTGSLSTTANATFDTIPQLTGGGILPEASPVIRDYYIVIEGNTQANNATTDFTISVNIDSGSSFSFGTIENALASDCFVRYIYKPSVPTTTTTHTFQLWNSLATKMNHVTATLVVTYEFTLSGTTRTLNSIMLPLEIDSPMAMNNVSAEASRFQREFICSDEGTITLRQSSYRLNWNSLASVSTVRTRAGGQSYKVFTTLGSMVCGMFSLQHRIDSGGASGAGITLARGLNTFTIDAYASGATVEATNINGYIILNYESDIGSSGIGQNTHTVLQKVLSWNASLTDSNRIPSFNFDIPETNYYLNAVGFCFIQWIATLSQAVTFDAEMKSGEGKGSGYTSIYADAYVSDAERSCSIIWMRGRDVYRRYPTDPDPDRIAPETARIYRLYTTTACGNGVIGMLTYHSHTFTSTLTVDSSAGGTVQIEVFRADTNERILSTSRVGNGTVDVLGYNDVIDVYAVARESDALLTRSANFNFGD